MAIRERVCICRLKSTCLLIMSGNGLGDLDFQIPCFCGLKHALGIWCSLHTWFLLWVLAACLSVRARGWEGQRESAVPGSLRAVLWSAPREARVRAAFSCRPAPVPRWPLPSAPCSFSSECASASCKSQGHWKWTNCLKYFKVSWLLLQEK